MQEVRVKRGLSYGASAHLGQGRGARALSMGMAPAIEQTVETLALVLSLWRDFVAHGLSDDEVEFAKQHLASGFAFQMATPEDRIDVRIGVLVMELPGDFLATMVPAIRAVTPGAVRAAMARHLDADDLAVTVVSTAEALLPDLRRTRLFPERAIEIVAYDSY
jgi:zinc protease